MIIKLIIKYLLLKNKFQLRRRPKPNGVKPESQHTFKLDENSGSVSQSLSKEIFSIYYTLIKSRSLHARLQNENPCE